MEIPIPLEINAGIESGATLMLLNAGKEHFITLLSVAKTDEQRTAIMMGIFAADKLMSQIEAVVGKHDI